MGAALFALVALADAWGVEAETALRRYTAERVEKASLPAAGPAHPARKRVTPAMKAPPGRGSVGKGKAEN